MKLWYTNNSPFTSDTPHSDSRSDFSAYATSSSTTTWCHLEIYPHSQLDWPSTPKWHWLETVCTVARLGGLGITLPSAYADWDFEASLRVTSPLRDLLRTQDHVYSFAALDSQMSARADICRERRQQVTLEADSLRDDLTPTLQRAMNLARERGSSSWLTSLPIKEHGFCLHKSAFVDALALRYGWAPSRTPTTCACGASFSVEHVLSCPKGGFPSIRHNELRDLTASLLTEVCNDVCVKPTLQPITTEVMTRHTANTTEGARLDIAVNGFWGGRYERSFLDVRVFNPYATSNRNTSIEKCFKKHEQEKKRAYEQRILDVEHASFTLLVFSASGGLSKEATTFYKRLASLLADQWDQPYSTTMNWLRCTLSFCLLRSSIQCIRGARSSIGRFAKAVSPVDLVTAGPLLRWPSMPPCANVPLQPLSSVVYRGTWRGEKSEYGIRICYFHNAWCPPRDLIHIHTQSFGIT